MPPVSAFSLAHRRCSHSHLIAAKILTNMATQSVLPKLEQWAKDQSKMDHFYNEAAAKGEQDEVQPPNCELCVGIVGLLG